MRKALVAGGGGFIGHHLIKFLKGRDYWVRSADIARPEYEDSFADEFQMLDLREFEACMTATEGVDEVYQLAADMGGIGFITAIHADVARNNVLINAHLLEAAHKNNVDRMFYSSSACIYPTHLQDRPDVTALKEDDAYPAQAEEGYGWEKLYSEKLCQYYREDKGLQTRVARFHNVFGPLGTYDGGREKAPAAICRKVALAEDGGEIEIWGDGLQTRSFMYVDDCVAGIFKIMQSDYSEPLNLGTDDMITVDDLVDLTCKIANKTLRKRHDPSKPQGVRGRNSDNSKLRELFAWEPEIDMEEGLRRTYPWILEQLEKEGRIAPRASED